MKLLPIGNEIIKYLQKHNLEKKFNKQLKLFKTNLKYPSLEVELLEPKSKKIYSFRVDRKYRAIFIFRDDLNLVEILMVSNHYK